MSTTEGYKGHRPGSNKGKLHKVFDEKGREAAILAAERAGIKKGTISSWMWSWGSENKRAAVGKLTPAAKKAMAKAKAQVKAESKKAPAKKAPAKKAAKKSVKKAA